MPAGARGLRGEFGYRPFARHYSPTLGRFLQPDPDGSESTLYAYTANN